MIKGAKYKVIYGGETVEGVYLGEEWFDDPRLLYADDEETPTEPVPGAYAHTFLLEDGRRARVPAGVEAVALTEIEAAPEPEESEPEPGPDDWSPPEEIVIE